MSLPGGAPRWPRALRDRLERELRPAGVLVPIIDRGSSLSLLLTQRAAHLKHHAGQISFPGGRMEAGDADILRTALRETEEETGIAPALVEVVGYLEPSPTVSGYAVTPVVGIISGNFELRLDPTEVEEAFEVPLDFLLDPQSERQGVRLFEGFRVPVVEFRYRERRIWGATANILIRLRSQII